MEANELHYREGINPTQLLLDSEKGGVLKCKVQRCESKGKVIKRRGAAVSYFSY